MNNCEEKSIDCASKEILNISTEKGFCTAFDRHEVMEPECGFGQLGICCKNCVMGPCRIDPFGEGAKEGICGATADVIAARNLIRMLAAGAAAHSDHGRDIAHTLLATSEGKTKGYTVKGKEKLFTLAKELNVKTENRKIEEIAHDVAEKCFAEFGQQHGELQFTHRAPKKRQELWRKGRFMPRGIDREIVEIMHRTHIGVDNDHENLIQQGIRASLGDGWGGSMIATDLSDVIFGMPEPIRSITNLGVLKEDEVNVIVHGHEPTLSDVIVAASQDKELLELAKSYGAKGINLAGICCTANEILMRHGISVAGNFLQQELAVITGAVDLMLVDVQCIMPALGNLCQCFHTKFVSTSPKAKFPFAEHVEFSEEDALPIAKKIVRMAVENYKNRKKELVKIPKDKMELIAGFTAEYVYKMLGGKYRSTYRPLNDAIISGRLRGAAGIVGCNNPKVKHDWAHVTLAKELIKKDVLVVVTGCSAIADAKAGLLVPEAAKKYAGRGLQEICEAVGIPPVLHLGSCVDCSRILTTLANVVLEGGLGEDISDLPVAGAAPEWMSEKAVSIGFYVAASGVYTVLGFPFPVLGGKKITQLLTKDLEKLVGANFDFEPDPVKAADLIIKHLDKKREALKLKPVMYGE
ncbi:MAG: anaerobic carbon-monoxide dehydrogenase catalytic subunit [Elusimicrobia bacterium]|nr:anaerobic carbon-monoxide dehydrogenase catalytic subunit [Elusimicrobiota bacterium]